jgi:ribosomal protein L11 methyltransferase
MQWTGIAIDTPTLETENVVVQLLINAGCAGVALSGEGELRCVTTYLTADDNGRVRLTQLLAAISLLPALGVFDAGVPVITAVDEEDWANSWKAYFKPLRIGRRIVVSPPWEDARLTERELLITIDPGMAFGTGTHATTQMCLSLIEDYLRLNDTVADIGTGSGILAIAASKLGASMIIAVDNDPLAVKIAGENAKINKSDVLVQSTLPEGQQFDLVVANIIADTLIALADGLASMTADGAILIVSGVIDDRVNDVRLYVETAGFTALETREQGEWRALAFRRLSR